VEEEEEIEEEEEGEEEEEAEIQEKAAILFFPEELIFTIAQNKFYLIFDIL